jgi:predicted RNase H-like HicB family nuclease
VLLNGRTARLARKNGAPSEAGLASENCPIDLQASRIKGVEVSKTTGYIALVHKDKGTSYGVSFPDVPGCISAGDTFEEAVANASEALAGHLSLMTADGDVIPNARSLEELKEDNEFLDDSTDAVVAFVAPLANQITTLQLDTNPGSAIKRFAYEALKRELFLTFTDGRTYVYDNVPPEVVEAFKAAQSKAAFLNLEIRDRYPHREFGESFLVAAE